MKVLSTVVVSTIFLFSAIGASEAVTKSYRNKTITMQAGNKAGLHEVYSWNAKCRSVRLRVSASRPKHGRILVVRDNFKISARQSKHCAGKRVSGYRVVYKADRKFKGSTLVRYRIDSPEHPDSFAFSRKMVIK